MGKREDIRELLMATANAMTPENWTQHVGARSKDGNATSFDSASAVCWCLLGQLQRQATLLKLGGFITSEAVKVLHFHGHPVTINDRPKQTVENVITFVKECSRRWL